MPLPSNFDTYLTSDPFDDGHECHDMEGNPYPEHDWPEPGAGGDCLRCGAELDPA